jgi:hypothetical protein
MSVIINQNKYMKPFYNTGIRYNAVITVEREFVIITLEDLRFALENNLPINPEPNCEFTWEEFLLEIQNFCEPIDKLIFVDLSRTTTLAMQGNTFDPRKNSSSFYNTGEKYIQILILPNIAEVLPQGDYNQGIFYSFKNLEIIMANSIITVNSYCFIYTPKLKSVSLLNCEVLKLNSFSNCMNIYDIFLPQTPPDFNLMGNQKERLFSNKIYQDGTIYIHIPSMANFNLYADAWGCDADTPQNSNEDLFGYNHYRVIFID